MYRIARKEDFSQLRHIYRKTVQKLAPSLYSSAQVKAWAKTPDNRDQFWQFIYQPITYLLSEGEKVIAFCGLEDNGHIASLYVHPDHTRQGHGTKLLAYVLERGREKEINRFYTEASFFSRSLFARFDFQVMEMEEVYYGNVAFQRYKMEKIIA